MSPLKKILEEAPKDKGIQNQDIIKKLKTSGKYDSHSFLARMELHQKEKERHLSHLREKVTAEKETREQGNYNITPRTQRNHIHSPRENSNQRPITPDKLGRISSPGSTGLALPSARVTLGNFRFQYNFFHLVF